jgi:SAM-dependent methyltransferase
MAASPPQPPARLISRVHGTSEPDGFGRTGRVVALDIYGAAGARVDMDQPLRILDFGCGCGRVMGYMGEIAPASAIHGSDIDGEAIAWCEANFGGEVRRGRFSFAVNRDRPPTAFDPGYFDLVYGISVFTHLPEDMQFQWLAELRRITRPGGILVLSVQGAALIRGHLAPEEARQFERKGFHYFPYGGTEGLPDYYQAAWHDRSYIDRVWSEYFEVLEQVPGGIAGHQDLILCRRPPSGP